MNAKKTYSSALLIVLFVISGVMAWPPPPPPPPCTPTPGAFSLTSPSSLSVKLLDDITLLWGTSTDADIYYIYLDTSENPTTYRGSTSDITWNPQGILEPGKTYYWKIKALNTGSCATSSAWSTQTFQFTVASVFNLTDGTYYGNIQDALDHASDGDEI